MTSALITPSNIRKEKSLFPSKAFIQISKILSKEKRKGSARFSIFLIKSSEKLFCPMSESPGGKREGFQDNAIHKKGKFITDSSQGFCHNQHSGAGSESPAPKLLTKFIGCA